MQHPPLDRIPEVLRPDIKFMRHQREGIARMWNMKSFILADDPGLGKTLQTLAVCAIHAHMTKETRGFTSRILVVAPPSLKRNWANEVEKFTGFRHFLVEGEPKKRDKIIREYAEATGHRVLIMNYEQIPKHLSLINQLDLDIVIADECFVGSKMISTPDGDRRIDQIAAGDIVYGYDHEREEVIETTVRATGQRKSSLVIGGLGSTPNHPYWVEGSGYRPAGDITETDMGYAIQTDSEGVRVVRRPILGPGPKDQVLREELRESVEVRGSRVPGTSQGGGTEPCHAPGLARECVGTNEEEQSVPGSRGVGTNHCNPKGGGILRPQPHRRKRDGADQERAALAGAAGPRMGVPSGAGHQSASTGVPVVLQDRPGAQGHHARDRVRWVVPLPQRQEGAGSQENGLPGVQGVDDLAILEPRDIERYREGCEQSRRDDEVDVYNLETESSNYFAGGLLVHNCHYLKNPRARRTGAFRQVEASRRFMLTGTPVLNHVDDLWVLLDQVQPGQWGTYWGFCQHHCIYGGFQNKAIIGVKNEKQLTENLNRIMVRRLKTDVLDLPEVQVIKREVDLLPGQLSLYKRAVKDMILERDAARGEDGEEEIANPAIRFMRLAQICSTTATVREDGKDESGKLDAAMVDLDTIVSTGEKVVVFTKFRATLACYVNRILAAYKGDVPVYVLSGDVKTDERQAVVDAWSGTSGACVIVCMIQVAGVGLNMTSGRYVQFLDKDVTPANNEQAIARVHRIGQGQHAVQVYEYQAKASAEARLEALLANKKATANEVVEDKSLQDMLNQILDEEME